MDKLLDLLQKINPNIDFEHEEHLVKAGLDSLDIIAIIEEIQAHFGIELDASDIDPDNFISIEAIWKMIEKHKNE